MAKRIGDIEGDVITTGGLLLGGYFLVKNLFPSFLPNLGVSDADRQTLDAQQTSPANIFNSYNGNPSYGAWAVQNFDFSHYGVDNSTDYLNAVYNDFIHGNLPPSSPLYPTIVIYYDLYKALIGHLYSGDQNAINAALNTITNKYQVGFISELFADINGQDFWSLLRNGQFTMLYGLNGADLATQVTRLNNLPD